MIAKVFSNMIDLGSMQKVTKEPNSQGIKGQISYYNGYIYLCIETNTWIRFPITTSW